MTAAPRDMKASLPELTTPVWVEHVLRESWDGGGEVGFSFVSWGWVKSKYQISSNQLKSDACEVDARLVSTLCKSVLF